MSKKNLLVIFLISLCLRSIWLLLLWLNPEKSFDNDSFLYIALAESLIDSGTFPSIFRTPLYPFFIAIIYGLFGKFLQAVLCIQYLLDSTTSLIVMGIFSKIGGNTRYAFIAGLAYAINPFAIFASNTILTETLFTFIFSMAIYFLVTFLKDKNRKKLVIFAFILALSALCRPISLFVPIALIFFVISVKGNVSARISNGLVFILIFYCTLLPWYVRNYHQFGYWGLSTIDGYNFIYYESPSILMIKKNPFTTIQFDINKPFEEEQKYIWHNLREKYKWDNQSIQELIDNPSRIAIMKAEGMKVITANPHIFFLSHLSGIGRTLFPFYPRFAKFLETDSLSLKVFMMCIDVLIMGCALLGVISVELNRGNPVIIRGATLLFIVLIVYFSFLPGVYSYSRFRVPVLPYISIFVSLGIWKLQQTITHRSARL
jgi:4-amino-4-deoxy-L-arabinose transferase-like glycosyltransferase